MAGKLTFTIFFLLATTIGGFAEDRLEIKTVANSLFGAPTNNSSKTITGAKFQALQKDITTVVALLGDQTIWTDFGPDASYVSIEIHIGNKHYTLNSWYPLYRNTPTVAVSETHGLVLVSNAVEKEKIENANSAKYRTIVKLFDEAALN